MDLDITPLCNAIERLVEGVDRHRREPNDTQIRDGLIQRFEFTYEIAHKTLKRYLERSAASPTEFEQADFAYLIRSANERGLLRGDWTHWKTYRDMRARTSHSYDESVARAVVEGIPAFAEEAAFLRERLKAALL